MGLRKIFQGFVAFLLVAAVAAGVLFSFRYHPLIRRTIGPDGICGPFDEVLVYSPHLFRLTDNGERYSFLARDTKGYYVVEAGREYGPFDDVISLRTISESDSWGFVGQKGKTLYVFVDGVIRAELHDKGDIWTDKRPGVGSIGRPLIRLMGAAPTLSVAGDNWIFTVKRPDGKYVLLNGEEIGPYEQVYNVRISPSGDDWGIIAAIDGAEYIIVNGDTYGPFAEGKELDLIEPRTETYLVFSPEGTEWTAYGGPSEAKRLLINGEWFGPYEGIACLRWSENWETWVLSGLGSQGPYFVINGTEYGPYESVGELGKDLIWVNVSRNGSSWGTHFVDNGDWYVSINGVVHGPYDETSEPYFSADGKQWGFPALIDETVYIIVNGEVRRTSETNKYGTLPPPPYFWDGHVIYSFIADGAWYVDFDGETFGPFSENKTQFMYLIAVGGDSWAYSLREDQDRYLIINGEKYGPFLFVDGNSFVFDERGTYWACRVPDYSGNNVVYLREKKYGPYYFCRTFASGNTVGFWAIEELPDKMYRLVKETATGEGVSDEP